MLNKYFHIYGNYADGHVSIIPVASVITKPEQEKELKMQAPFRDRDGNILWTDSVVVNEAGTEMILRFGPYTAYDEDGTYDGWGWFLQSGMVSDEGKLLIYQVLPVSADTPDYITLKGRLSDELQPCWYDQFLELAIVVIETCPSKVAKQEENTEVADATKT